MQQPRASSPGKHAAPSLLNNLNLTALNKQHAHRSLRLSIPNVYRLPHRPKEPMKDLHLDPKTPPTDPGRHVLFFHFDPIPLPNLQPVNIVESWREAMLHPVRHVGSSGGVEVCVRPRKFRLTWKEQVLDIYVVSPAESLTRFDVDDVKVTCVWIRSPRKLMKHGPVRPNRDGRRWVLKYRLQT